MSPIRKPDRRGFLTGGLSLGALSLLTGCDLTGNEPAQRLLWNMSGSNDRVQGWLFYPNRLAPTYPESAVDRVFRTTPSIPRSRRRSSILRPTGSSSAAQSVTSGPGPSTISTSCRGHGRPPGMFVSRAGAGSANGAAARCGSFSSMSRPTSPRTMSASSTQTGITPASTCQRRSTRRPSWPSHLPIRYCRASSAIR